MTPCSSEGLGVNALVGPPNPLYCGWVILSNTAERLLALQGGEWVKHPEKHSEERLLKLTVEFGTGGTVFSGIQNSPKFSCSSSPA